MKPFQFVFLHYIINVIIMIKKEIKPHIKTTYDYCNAYFIPC